MGHEGLHGQPTVALDGGEDGEALLGFDRLDQASNGQGDGAHPLRLGSDGVQHALCLYRGIVGDAVQGALVEHLDNLTIAGVVVDGEHGREGHVGVAAPAAATPRTRPPPSTPRTMGEPHAPSGGHPACLSVSAISTKFPVPAATRA